MTKLFYALIFFTLASCNDKMNESKYIVTTKVQIKPGEINNVLELFKNTNPDLVKDQSDWVKAVFSKNEASSFVKVQAYWKNKESYIKFSSSDKFQNTMQRFGKYFNGKPEVDINEILFVM